MAAYCCSDDLYPLRKISTGDEATTRCGVVAVAAASSWDTAAAAAVTGLLALLRLEGVEVLAWLAIQSPKTLSAAARVGFSRVRAGVPVRDRERRVDLPKEPVSATERRERVLAAGPSCLVTRKEKKKK
jgi:hypothetical protein